MSPEQLNPEQKAKYKEVAEELRCLVCQNQSIADSQAGLATDLKGIIAEQIIQGKSKSEIKSFMEARYGEFILYKPAYSSENIVLWIAPFLVLLVAVILAKRVIKSSNAIKAVSTSVESGTLNQNKDSSSNWAEALYSQESDSKNSKDTKDH
ncbi:MAG: cytochrome c-type biogenesis protein CcmH [Limnobacter sp.]|nr:cytochrome c-type biogenesis protein CcmH [Limnobacter sp.]